MFNFNRCFCLFRTLPVSHTLHTSIYCFNFKRKAQGDSLNGVLISDQKQTADARICVWYVLWISSLQKGGSLRSLFFFPRLLTFWIFSLLTSGLLPSAYITSSVSSRAHLQEWEDGDRSSNEKDEASTPKWRMGRGLPSPLTSRRPSCSLGCYSWGSLSVVSVI